jgi:CRISPR-associated protein (TIGR03986 family)
MTEDKETGQLFKHPMVQIANGIGFLKFNEDSTVLFTDYSIETVDDYGRKKYAIRKIKDDQIKKAYTTFNRKDDYLKKYKQLQGAYATINVQCLANPDNSRRYLALYDKNAKPSFIVANTYIDGKAGGKKYEFILSDGDKKDSIKLGTNEQEKIIIDNFKKVYFSKGDSDTHKLGQFWKKQLQTPKGKKYGIPVFVKKSAKGKIQAIGLTQIFKLAYNKTLLEAAEQKTKKDRYDLAETIFGYVDGKNALKGRVIFSHFKSNTVSYQPDTKSEILGSPNPSYYPNYIEQEELDGSKVKRYTTLMDDATIRGYKHYPLQPKLIETQSSDKEKVKTHFKPLDTGTTFEGVLRFHNLKKAEIGALLSALTFHNQGDDYRHNIGMAKSLGYGKISITLEKFTYSEKLKKENQTEYIESFKEMMNSWNDKPYANWKDSPQLQNLLAMHDNTKAKSLRYQQLDKQEFSNAKKKREYLEPYVASKIVKVPKKSPVAKEKVTPVKSEGVSKTKMRVTLRESWLRVFKIPYVIHDVKYYNQQKSELIEDEQVKNVYLTIKDSKKMQQICKYIELFFADKVEVKDQEALYKAIQELK